MSWIRRLGALAIVIALVGCGGGSSKSSADATDGSSSTDSAASDETDSEASDERTPKELAADRKLAEDAILRLSDFPKSFTSEPRDPSTEDSPEEKAAEKRFADCSGLDPSLLEDDDAEDEAKAKSDKFKSGQSLEVQSSASVSASEDEQRKQFESFKKPKVADCFGKFFQDAIEVSLDNPAPGKTVPEGLEFGTVDVEEAKLDGLHADAVIYRARVPVTFQGQSFAFVTDFVLALAGRTGLTLTFDNADEPFPENLEVDLINTSIDRAKGG